MNPARAAQPARGWSREPLFAFAFLLLTLNGLTTFFGGAVAAQGWSVAALNLFDISAIVWLALAAGLALLWSAPAWDLLRAGDRVVLSGALLAALLPVAAVSSLCLTGLAVWCLRTGAPGAPLRRAGIVFLSLTAFLLWGRIALAWGAGPLLTADARFVAWLAGTQSLGNAVEFADGTRFLIAPGCSSLHGVSLALILWTTVVQYFGLATDRRAWATLALAVTASIAVNGARLAVIAWHPHDFAYWHGGTGAALFGWIALIILTAVIYRGLGHARRPD